MTATPKLLDRDDTPREDHFVHLRGAAWADYERVLAIRGDRSAPRIAYLDGTLEIMSPSRHPAARRCPASISSSSRASSTASPRALP